MNDVERLRVLIPHWIEHYEEHADEFRHWAETADQTPRLAGVSRGHAASEPDIGKCAGKAGRSAALSLYALTSAVCLSNG
jgi:hypothetical protein